MDDKDLLQQISILKEKLSKAQRQTAGLKEKSKCLEMQYGDSKNREQTNNELVMELLERQRELNVMLNRANIMLSRTQEAMALTSLEFNEMVKALPEPKKAEWSDRVSRINDIFKKTGIQDAEVLGLESSNPRPGDSFSKDEMKKESEEAFGKQSSIWDRREQREPPRIQAELVEEDEISESQHEQSNISYINTKVTISDEEHEISQESSDGTDQESVSEDDSFFQPRKKSWWHKIAG